MPLLSTLFPRCAGGLLTVMLVLLATQARAQKPVLYLSVANPDGPLLVNPTKNFTPVLAPLLQRLRANGYRVITTPDTLRQLLAQPDAPRFLYADVVCYQAVGDLPTVIFAVRDSLNLPWYVRSESTRMFLSQQKAFSNAVEHLAKEMPTVFRPRFPTTTPDDRGPQFMGYDKFDFASYFANVLYAAPLRQQVKQGAELELDFEVDELGFATLKTIGNELVLDETTREQIATTVSKTPPWGPAYRNGRRVSAQVRLRIGRVTRVH